MREWINITVTLLALAAVWWRRKVRAAENSDIEESGSDMEGAEGDLH